MDSESDLTVVCGDILYHVHIDVVCSHSRWFANAVDFKVKQLPPGQEIELPIIIDLSDDDPDSVDYLIQYLYEGDYPPIASWYTPYEEVVMHTCTGCVWPKNPSDPDWLCPHHACGIHCDLSCDDFICTKCHPALAGGSTKLLTHAKMYELADKYNMVALKRLAIKKFKAACRQWWDYDTFPIAAYHVFETTPTNDWGLRDVVAGTIYDHIELIQKPEIYKLLDDIPELARRMLYVRLAREREDRYRAENGAEDEDEEFWGEANDY